MVVVLIPTVRERAETAGNTVQVCAELVWARRI